MRFVIGVLRGFVHHAAGFARGCATWPAAAPLGPKRALLLPACRRPKWCGQCLSGAGTGTACCVRRSSRWSVPGCAGGGVASGGGSPVVLGVLVGTLFDGAAVAVGGGVRVSGDALTAPSARRLAA